MPASRTPDGRDVQRVAFDELDLDERDIDGADIPLKDLLRDAFDGAKELAKIEVALGKDELLRELAQLKGAAILLVAGLVVSAMGVVMLLVTLAMFIGNPFVSLGIAIGLLVIAAIASYVGYSKLPKNPMAETKRRLESDVETLKERIAT